MDTPQWFYLKNGQQHGPLETDNLASLFRSGALPPYTPVYTATQSDWIPASDTGIFPKKPTTRLGPRRMAKAIALLLIAFGLGYWLNYQPPAPIVIQKNAAQPAAPQQSGTLQFRVASSGANPEIQLARSTSTDTDKIAEYDRQLAKAKIDLLDAQRLLREAREFNTKIQRQIKQLQAAPPRDPRLAEANRLRQQLEQQLAAANRLNIDLRQRLAQRQARSVAAKPDNALVERLRDATEELEAARQKISSLEQQLQSTAIVAQPSTSDPEPAPSAAAKPAQALGQIINLDAPNQSVVINRGSDHGLEKGNQFRIISRANGEFLGRLTIRRARATFAVGTLDGSGFNRLQSGDLLYR